MKFDELNLSQNILKAIKAEGYQVPSEIQEAAIPPLLLGKDLIGCAQTGTGKTAAFALPIIHLLEKRGITPHRNIRSLVLTPTRELAMQIFESFHSYGRYTKLKYGVIFGGVSQKPQEVMLHKGIDVLIATPGRLNDLIGQGFIHLEHVEIFVLDEADRMLDMGFINDVKKVIRHVPEKKQTLLFSATMPGEIREIANRMMTDPVQVAVKPVSSTVDTVSQAVYLVDKDNKQSLLTDILKERNPSSTLVFTKTKHGADKVVRKLEISGIRAAAIHGNKSQNNRQLALNNFKSGQIKVLVATDIAARGIDVDKLALVVNFDLPDVPETYVHRIGRTGRAGKEGDSLSFCDYSEKPLLADIEKLIQKSVPVVTGHPYPMAVFTVPPKEQRGRRPQREASPSFGKNAQQPKGGNAPGVNRRQQSSTVKGNDRPQGGRPGKQKSNPPVREQVLKKAAATIVEKSVAEKKETAKDFPKKTDTPKSPAKNGRLGGIGYSSDFIKTGKTESTTFNGGSPSKGRAKPTDQGLRSFQDTEADNSSFKRPGGTYKRQG